MIPFGLVAAKEEVGGLPVLNTANGGCFTEEECRLPDSVAEDIALAIRDANVFEDVVNGCRKQRQVRTSHQRCKRPLGSYTPCVQYPDSSVRVGAREWTLNFTPAGRSGPSTSAA